MHYRDKPWLKFYDPHVPPTLSYPAHTLHAYIEAAAEEEPDLTAVISTAALPLLGRKTARLSYGELNAQADALASALRAMGLQQGDRVALVLPNCAAFAVAFYGVLKAGGIVVATNPTYPPARMRRQFEAAGVKVAIVLSKFYAQVKSIQAETPVEHVIVTNIKAYLPPAAKLLFTLFRERKDGHRVARQPGDHWLQDLLAGYAGQRPGVEVTPDDVCIFQFTGGTTGTPKAAVCTHRALVANTAQCHAWVSPERAKGEHNFIAALPLFHVYGLISVLTFGASFRAALVMIPEPREIEEIIACIDYYRCDAFMGVPAFYNTIVSHPAAHKYDLSSVSACISGAAPLSPETKARFEALTGGVLVEGYGMSETPSVTHINPIEGENRAGSIGLPVPDVECRVVDLADGQTDVPVGEPGELIVRGPQLMNHYHNMPTETADAMRAGPDGAQWFYTGDIVRMDEDGFFYTVDRKKDVVIIGGFTVYPTLVESVLSELPQIADVAVAGIPHPDPIKVGQEALKAWVVLKAGQSLTEKAMIAHASTKLAPYEVPYRYAFVDSLPKTIVGKTLRRELVQMEMLARER